MSLHQRAKEVFLASLDRHASERLAFLAEACGDDAALRHEVESLLAFHDQEPPETAALESFAPGDVFAGRYRMVTRLGQGGMGDVWRADDLILKTPVALKLIRSASPESRELILNEVRLARQITHPAVCRVFDVGEAEGGIFFSMELVEGEDLAALIRRVGRLPSEKVADIGRQLCSGLQAAHAHGVLHRDLKPANVLIDNDGLVRITDFGIAVAAGDRAGHLPAGTPGYMAPEQLAAGAEITERTDLYALGLLLYELLVGRDVLRLSGGTNVPPPSTLVSNVNPQLERVIMHALARDPRDRPPTALEMGAKLPAAEINRRWKTPGLGRRWLVATAALVGLVAALVLATSFVSSGARTLTAQDTIVLADFENATSEPVFDGTLKVALAVALEQSPFLKVFPEERARDTLRLMQQAPDERITRSIAREIARREQLKALIAGSIASLGRNYVLTLEAFDANTGDVMGREQAEAPTKEQVLSALGRITSLLREKLGESLASIQTFDVPLPRATTPSLDALHAYALALYEGREVPRLEAIPHLKRAIELDPSFAMAHALLSEVYANTGQSSLAPAFSERAFKLRDRVSERERFFISWRYYRDAVGDWGKAFELARTWTAAYPREAFAFNSLGSADLVFARYTESADSLRRAIRLDPKFVPAYANLAAALLALDRPDEARRTLNDAEQQGLDFSGARRFSYLIAFVQNDSATMARELERAMGVRETNGAFGWEAHTSAFGGRIAAAHEESQRGIQMARQAGLDELAAQLSVDDAETHALAGQCADATRETANGLGLSRDILTVGRAARVLAWCGADAESIRLSDKLAKQSPEATLTQNVSLPVIAAATALKQNRGARALELLEAVRPYDHTPSAEFWPNYLRGSAYLLLKDGAKARAEFQEIVQHRGEVPASMLYPLAYLGLARAASLQHDSTSARTAYDALFTLWSAADSTLAPLQEARRERMDVDQAGR